MVEASPRRFDRVRQVLWSSTADVARPSALREATERCAPVIARLFLSLVLQPLPPGEAERRLPDKRPFARILNGDLLIAVWLAIFWRSPQYPPHPRRFSDNGLRNRVSAAFRPSSRTSFTTCGRTPPAGRVLAAPVLPRSLPYSIQFSLQRLWKVALTFRDAAILLFRSAGPTAVGSAHIYSYTTCVAEMSSVSLN